MHLCHAHSCKKQVSPAMFMCKPHWFSLRKPLRDAVWHEYRPGQENDKRPSARYMAVQRRAVAEVAFKANDEDAARAAAPYLIDSERFRALAIAQGEGDPLEGLTSAAPGLSKVSSP